MLKIWGRGSSLNVQKVLWLVGELELEHEHVLAGGSFGRLGDPDFQALTPIGKVPVVEDGALAIWESHAILRYLAARYGKSGFWDKDPAVRSQVDRWMDWFQTALQPVFLGGLFGGFYRTPEARRNWPAIRRSLALCVQMFGVLDQELDGRPFLVGERLSLADIAAGSALYRWYALEIERPALPNLRAWYDRLGQRRAYREHVMVPFDELRGRA